MIRTLTRIDPNLEQKEILADEYSRQIKDKTQAEAREVWLNHQSALFKLDGDLKLFRDIRNIARLNGGISSVHYLNKRITAREFVAEIRLDCADVYAQALEDHRVVRIDITDSAYLAMRNAVTTDSLDVHAKVTDPTNKTQVCTAQALTWHRFVEALHGLYSLPSVKTMKDIVHWDSDAELAVLESGEFNV